MDGTLDMEKTWLIDPLEGKVMLGCDDASFIFQLQVPMRHFDLFWRHDHLLSGDPDAKSR